MRTADVITVDFETDGIEQRPSYPPLPIGVSIKWPGKPVRYYGFGHVDCHHCGEKARNNCTEKQAKEALAKVWRSKLHLLFQNAKFDLDVAETHWGFKVPKWDRIHDDLYLIFLDDPNQQTFSLKPASERLLGMKPSEKDEVRDWMLKHQPVPGVKVSASQSSPTYFMKYLRFAPASVVGPYANGDVVRTERVFKLLWPRTKRRGMLGAYDRERRLMPILLDMERRGLPVWHEKLKTDVARYTAVMARLAAWIRSRLKCSEEVNLDSGEQLFDAMLCAGVIDRKVALRTPTGKYQTNKEALLLAVKDKPLLAVMKYRTQLKTCLNTFMVPWLTTASAAAAKGLCSKAMLRQGKSLIYTNWNQVKGDARGGNVGARTGRLSSTPNFQNIPKMFAFIFAHEEARLPKAERKGLPRCPLKGLPPLPQVRSYVAPFPGEVLIDRDFNQQEPRILAHFDGGALMKMYVDDPWMDFHTAVQKELLKAGLRYERKYVKATSLGIMYGQGSGLLAERLGITVEEAKKLKTAILRILVGLKEMYQDCKLRASEGRPVRTWGLREYYVEPPKVVDGRFRTFDYKLVNVLIQGSAADATKEAIIRYDAARPKTHKLLLNVHDQLTASVPKAQMKNAMEIMRTTMESIEMDVKLLSTGSTSETDWASLKDYDVKGKLCA